MQHTVSAMRCIVRQQLAYHSVTLPVAYHLESARVGEQATRPRHEVMQTARLGDDVSARPGRQVVRVSEHDVAVERLQLLHRQALDGA